MLEKLLKSLICVSALILPFGVAADAASANARVSPRQNELLAVGAMKQLYAAQARYYAVFQGRFADLASLGDAGLIDDRLRAGQKYGYFFNVAQIAATATTPSRFYVWANPQNYRKTGVRSFYMSSTCLISAADRSGGNAEAADPVIDECVPTVAYDIERSVVQAELAVANAQATYQATTGAGNFASHDQLLSASLLLPPFGPMSNLAFRHTWTVTTTPQTGTAAAGFRSWATPMFYRETGIRSFYIDQTGVLRGADRRGEAAREDDPVVASCVTCSPADNERTAVELARNVYGVERMYANLFGAGNFGLFAQLRAAALFALPFDSGSFAGYTYSLDVAGGTQTTPARFQLRLTPQRYGATGRRSFYIDELGILRGADHAGAPADADDPVILF